MIKPIFNDYDSASHGQFTNNGTPNETYVYFMQKSQGTTANAIDEFTRFQEYFNGKNFSLVQRQDLLDKKIKDIQLDVEA